MKHSEDLQDMDAPTTVQLGDRRIAIRTIYCIGRNYAEHAAELANPVPAEPVVFLKSQGALRPLADKGSARLAMAFPDETFHHEAELVLLVGQAVPLGGSADWSAVAGLALGLDLTRREVQTQLKAKGLPWTTAKSFAGAAVVTPFAPTAAFATPDRIHFSLAVNGEIRQRGDTADMLFPVPVILTFLASLCPLRPGDLVYTGTPKGVGPIRRGDRVRLAFEVPVLSYEGVL